MHKKLVLIIIILSLISCLRKSNTERNINNSNNNNKMENIEQNSKIFIDDIQNIKVKEENLILNELNETISEKILRETSDKNKELKETTKIESIEKTDRIEENENNKSEFLEIENIENNVKNENNDNKNNEKLKEAIVNNDIEELNFILERENLDINDKIKVVINEDEYEI